MISFQLPSPINSIWITGLSSLELKPNICGRDTHLIRLPYTRHTPSSTTGSGGVRHSLDAVAKIPRMHKGALLGFLNFPKVSSQLPPTRHQHRFILPDFPVPPPTCAPEQAPSSTALPEATQRENKPREPGPPPAAPGHRRSTSALSQEPAPGRRLRPGPAACWGTPLRRPRRGSFPEGGGGYCSLPPSSPRFPAGHRGGRGGTSPPGRTLPRGGLRLRSTPRAAAGAAPAIPAPSHSSPPFSPPARPPPGPVPFRSPNGWWLAAPGSFPAVEGIGVPAGGTRQGTRRGAGSTYSRFSCGCS